MYCTCIYVVPVLYFHVSINSVVISHDCDNLNLKRSHRDHNSLPATSSALRRVMLSLRTCTSNAVRTLRHARQYITPIDFTPKVGETLGAPGALRPHLNIPVNPNHGLYAFFRKREKDGKVTHDPLEDDPGIQDVFGEGTAPFLHTEVLT